jgi:hypothetical protein
LPSLRSQPAQKSKKKTEKAEEVGKKISKGNKIKKEESF